MSKKVVIIDDNENNLLLEQDLLKVAGYEVFTARNAADGITIAIQVKPDIIVMDVRLPDIRGSIAAKIMRRDKATRTIPIVFVSASVLTEDRAEIKDIPNSGFIGKPINTRSFAKEIDQFIILNHKGYIDERQTSNISGR